MKTNVKYSTLELLGCHIQLKYKIFHVKVFLTVNVNLFFILFGLNTV